MKTLLAVPMLGLLLVGFMAVAVNADDDSEQVVKLKDCPKAVQKTLKRESRGGEIVEIEKEVENGKTIFEAEVMIDGKEYDIEVASDGTLLKKELEDEGDEEDDEDETASSTGDVRPQPGQGRGYRWRGGRGPGHGRGGGWGRGYGRGQGADPRFQKDREMFHFLLANRDSIDRKVKNLKDGVETVTESDDPKVAATIRKHVESMHDRVVNGNPIHMRDPLFAAIFRNADKIVMKVEPTKKGVRVIETSSDPYVATLIQAHAEVVNRFIANGHNEVWRNHAVPGRDD